MRNRKKVLSIILMVILLSFVFTSDLFAFSGLSSWVAPSGNGIDKIDKTANKIWGTITLIVQIASFTGILFTGIRYMFASADAKADMKSSMGKLLLGLALVFGAATVVDIIHRIVSEVL